MLCISHMSLAQYFRTNDIVHLQAQLVMYAHFLSVSKIQKSMFDCCKQIFKLVMNDQSIVLFDLDTCVDLCLYISSHHMLYIIAEAERKQIPTIKVVLTNRMTVYLKFRHVSPFDCFFGILKKNPKKKNTMQLKKPQPSFVIKLRWTFSLSKRKRLPILRHRGREKLVIQ